MQILALVLDMGCLYVQQSRENHYQQCTYKTKRNLWLTIANKPMQDKKSQHNEENIFFLLVSYTCIQLNLEPTTKPST